MRQLLSSVLTLRTNVILHHLNVSEHPQQDLLKIIMEVERQFLSIIASCTWTMSALAQVAWIQYYLILARSWSLIRYRQIRRLRGHAYNSLGAYHTQVGYDSSELCHFPDHTEPWYGFNALHHGGARNTYVIANSSTTIHNAFKYRHQN